MLAARRLLVQQQVTPPVFVASSSAVTSPSSVTSINVTVPAAAQVGDVIVIAAAMHDVPLTFDTPTGYTLAQNIGDNVSRLTTWYKIATSGDPGSTVTVNIHAGGSEWPAALCLVYRNIDQATPLVDSANFNSGTTTPWPAPFVAAGSKPAVGVYIWGTFRGATSYPLTFGSGTSRVDVVGTGREIAAADLDLAAGVNGRIVATPTGQQEYTAVSLAFQAP